MSKMKIFTRFSASIFIPFALISAYYITDFYSRVNQVHMQHREFIFANLDKIQKELTDKFNEEKANKFK